jgi:hypothetical protein
VRESNVIDHALSGANIDLNNGEVTKMGSISRFTEEKRSIGGHERECRMGRSYH